MRKLLFILLLLPFLSKAQTKTKLYVGGPLATNVYRGPLGSDSALYILSGCGNPNTTVPASNLGGFYNVYRGTIIYKDTCSDNVWTSNPDSTWSRLGNYFDTADLRGIYMDTTFQLNDSTIRYCKGTTCWDIRNGSTLITFEGDTTVVINNIRIKNLLSIPLTDTTHAKKSCGALIYDTIREHFYGDVCLNGVHAYWGCLDCAGSGTVTSVATNDGTGIKGGTITTTGTLFIDTSIISTKANVDSKTITLNQGSNVTITGTPTQNLGSNPSWTINATSSGGTVTTGANGLSNRDASTIILGGTLDQHTHVAGASNDLLIDGTDSLVASGNHTVVEGINDLLLESTTDIQGISGNTLTMKGVTSKYLGSTAASVGFGPTTTVTKGWSMATGGTSLVGGAFSNDAKNKFAIIDTTSGLVSWGAPAKGTTGQHLITTATGAAWADTTAVPTSYVSSWSGGTTGMTPNTATTGAVTMAGVLVEANGGTHQSTYTTGDILYASATNTLSKLPIGTAKQTLHVVGGVPAWIDTTATAAGATGANPTASVILTAVNGSASTFMRSDAAPPLDQSIAPTWTGKHIFRTTTMPGVVMDGTVTATANTQGYVQMGPTVTGRATASDDVVGVLINPSLISGSTTQIASALYINPTFTGTGGAFSSQRAITHKGDIVSITANTYRLGTSTLYYLEANAATTRTTTINDLSSNNITVTSAQGNVFRWYNGSNLTNGSGDVQIAAGNNIDASSNGYKLEVKGETKTTGGAIIAAVTTPTISTVTSTGGAAQTWSYKVVALMTNGAHTAASAQVSTTTGAATLDGSHFNTISWAYVNGARSYDVYMTASGGTPATTGKITNVTALAYNHTGGNGDGTTPPTINNTANFGVGTTTPTSNNQLLGSFALQYVAKTANYTATELDQTINFTANADTLTLPTAVGIQGRIYTVVNSGAGACQIKTTSSQTFVNINAAPTTLDMAAVGAGAITSYTVMSNNANWIVIGKVKNE